MDALAALDNALFRFINLRLSNGFLDGLMPFFAWNRFFVPAVSILAIALLWKGGFKGRLFVGLILLVVAVGDAVICSSLKEAIGRARPFNDIAEAHVLVGRGGSGSMPSGHAANWFAVAMVAFIYYRKSIWFMLPVALTVAFSRVYTGVHYPGDVLAGAALGSAYAAGMVWLMNGLWRWGGRRWFPLWWAQRPSLLKPDDRNESLPEVLGHSAIRPPRSALDQHWMRLGYVLILVLFFARLGYLAGGKIELSEDEAYQWLWSKHPALSYYSKPPLIAYTQFLGTTLWGDTAFGVRFFAPVIAAILSFLMLRFLAREANVRAGLGMILITTATPLLAVGATLMTIDPLSVLFWTAAFISGWTAVQQDSTRHWLWTGLWMGLGFLSKYTALLQLLCWAVFFVLWRPARRQWFRPGPYLSLLVLGLCTLPVLIWNAQHDWITVAHLATRGGLDQAWRPSLRFFWDFLIAETGLLNPVFFLAALWAALAFWRREKANPLLVYLFSIGAPLFLFYFLYTFRARVQPNWIAPSVLPLFGLMVIYWEKRWREGLRAVTGWFIGGVGVGVVVVVLLHDTNLIGKILGRPLPVGYDPLVRVRGWRDTAQVVETARAQLLAEGEPVFLIGSHYGITGLLSFYLPAAKDGVPGHPLAYYQSNDIPQNQFFFWPGYGRRKGENAVYVQKTDAPQPAPARLLKEFASVTDLGMHDVVYRGRVVRRIQLFACRNLQ
ncbi:MAG: glycosyltransferase family 39 protein [Chloroflexi bacterium]|nr:glycosyltransferase family 39 protein [Chloroflexota bacterium]